MGRLSHCLRLRRPSKSILDLKVDSVKRRLKDKAFAKGVRRDDVRKGAEELGVSLEEHIAFCIAALSEHADALGLRGTIPVEARPLDRVMERHASTLSCHHFRSARTTDVSI